MKLTDEHITQLNNGDINAFKAIYDDMYHSLCLYGYKMVPQEDLVNDIVQEAFIVLWNKRKEYHSILGTKSYLYSMVRNKILNHLRDSKTIPLDNKVFEEPAFDYQITKEETFKILRVAVDKLPAQTQKIINLAIEGCSNKEIAETLDISINTVKTLKRRGFANLREMLKDHVFVLLLIAELMQNHQ